MIDKQTLSFLGTVKEQYDELIFKVCPFCGNDKFNFQVNIEKDVYHDWACGAKGKLTKLLKDKGVKFDQIKWQSSIGSTVTVKNGRACMVCMDNFIPLLFTKHISFLLSKGLEPNDIQKYNLLTATSGKYKDKLIIPLFEGSNLVYFVARDMYKKGRYYNPPGEKSKILPYYLGTKHIMRLYLVEGAFDAISIHKLGYSVGILLGSHISKYQIQRIKDFGFNEIVVCLDGDLKKKAVIMNQLLIKNGLRSKIIWFDFMDDPNDLAVADLDYFKKIISNPKEVTLKDKVALALCK